MNLGIVGLLLICSAAALSSVPPYVCSSCGLSLASENYRRHMAFCAPDVLDPDGWGDGDREIVLATIRRRWREGSEGRAALELRFGGPRPIVSQSAVAKSMGWTLQRTRDTIAQLLHGISPPPEHVPITVLFEDSSVVAVMKPANVPVSPSHRLRPGSMLNRLIAHLGPGWPVPHPCHRLDLETSGVLVFAKHEEAAKALQMQFENGSVEKVYAALCRGTPKTRVVEGSICRVDGVDHCERRMCAPGEKGQEAKTELGVFATSRDGAHSLVLARPKQGRTHQVRIHCDAAGAPLVGDSLYGRTLEVTGAEGEPASSALINRHALHALSLRFRHPKTGAAVDVHAPLPDDMAALCERLALSTSAVPKASRPRGLPPGAVEALRAASWVSEVESPELPGSN